MVLDYSKWDALELSDDSDIEVHPNVDKRSFIRAKQSQIHQARFQRRHEISTLKFERSINDGLLKRIDGLLKSLRKHADAAGGPDQFMMQALMEIVGDPKDDEPPKPPEGVHTRTEQPKYSQMMASLVDQVKKEVGEERDDWQKKYTKGVEGHRKKVLDLQGELETKLAELEKEESKKITSDSIHTGFSQSSVSKEKDPPAPKPKTYQEESVEVLNPNALNPKDPAQTLSKPQSSDEEDDVEVSALGKEFSKIKYGDYKACLQFISTHPSVVAERETDGLLMEAFNAQTDGKAAYAKQCVHQALLLQYCRSLGRDGVGLFFKRITTPGHTAQKVFLDDVTNTYARIRDRTAELKKRRADPAARRGPKHPDHNQRPPARLQRPRGDYRARGL